MPLSIKPRGRALYIVGTVRPAGIPRGVRVRVRAGTDDAKLAAEEAVAEELIPMATG